MRASSLIFTNAATSEYIGNEPIFIKKTIVYGNYVYIWNTRFTALLNDFFNGVPIANLADYPHDLIEKYVEYANGVLPTVDSDYDLIQQYDLYLATLT